MTSKEMTKQYRLAKWAVLARGRTELGVSIRAYCAMKGFAENTYYNWQRRLRAVSFLSCRFMLKSGLSPMVRHI